jgi:hypothetical protein
MGQYGSAGFAFDPNAYMNQFMGQQAGLSNIVSGQLAPLQQALNSQAARSAAMGSEAAMAALGPGTRNSGAAMAAYGDAYANPFAQAALQTQQAQLYQQNMGLQTGMSQDQGMVYQPTYQYQPGFLDYAAAIATPVASAVMGKS